MRLGEGGIGTSMFDLFDGCGLFVIGVAVVFLLWGGCTTGKKAATRHFSDNPVYEEFQSAQANSGKSIKAAKEDARRMVDDAVARVREKERKIVAFENEVAFLESTAVPDENLKDDVAFDEADKKRIMSEFISWASTERPKEYGEACEAKREAEHYREKADERLMTLEKSIWNKVGISRPDDKLYRDYADKSEEEKKKHDKAIARLQDEFFEIETKKAVDEIQRIMDGSHGDDGVRSNIKRAEYNAARIRKEAEEALGK